MGHKMFVVLSCFVHFGFGVVSSSVAREYHYVDLKMNWTEAQHYCRTNYTDLATFDSMDDINKLNRPNNFTLYVWIGLADDPQSWRGTMGRDANSWRWSATGTFSSTGYHDFRNLSSSFSAMKTCGVIKKFDGWNEIMCSKTESSICYKTNDVGNKQYILDVNKRTWDEASSYCRTHYTDLAMIENEEENAQVDSVRVGKKVWIGLYRKPWRWSDGSSSSFTNWKTEPPRNKNYNEDCVVEDSDHLWHDATCKKERPFLCYKALPKTLLKMKIKMKSSADLSDPAVSAQILQQVQEMMRNKMPATDFQLRWNVSPEKEGKK